ncbi:MAG: PP2C family protein-serine/threonine phosphatase [Planctomycetota bacterium]|nr:PP2C family protein-serine/threonine phosphatase [Planctomycetota bacterium]
MYHEAELLKETDNLFNHEYEQELATWARRRFRNFCIVMLAFLGLGLFFMVIGIFSSGFLQEQTAGPGAEGDSVQFLPRSVMIGSTITMAIELFILITFFIRNRRTVDSSQKLISSATRMVMILSVLDVLMMGVVPIIFGEQGIPARQVSLTAGELFFWHLIPCLFLPWKPMQSLKAMLPAYSCFVLINALTVLLARPFTETDLSTIITGQTYALIMDAFSLLFFVPGVVICWTRLRRHGRTFRNRMLGAHFLATRRDMAQARTVHDALFPREVDDEHIEFTFEYHPYQEIGGDYVWFKRQGDRVRMVLLDVTGHGLPAAMTVNRISGELERICGEFPEADSLRLTELLARYFHLTMAPHRIFATGFLADLDLRTGTLQWVNAGHPTCYIVGDSEREMLPLASNTMMLGAVGPEEFEGELGTLEMQPGDSLICYTDGVSEARAPKGGLLGTRAVEQCLRGDRASEPWTSRLAGMARSHAQELLDDDILVTNLTLKNLLSGREREPNPELATDRSAESIS